MSCTIRTGDWSVAMVDRGGLLSGDRLAVDVLMIDCSTAVPDCIAL